MAEKIEDEILNVQKPSAAMNGQLAPMTELRQALLDSAPLAASKALQSLATAALAPAPALEALRVSVSFQQSAVVDTLDRLSKIEISPALAGFAEMAARIEDHLAPFAEMSRQIEQAARSFASTVDWDAVSKWSEGMTDLFRQLEESSRHLPAQTRSAVAALSQHGWYFDLEMPLSSLWKLEEAITRGAVAEADEALCAYYAGRAEEIIRSLKGRFPHRAKVLESALAAHTRGEYELAIPAFLIQADGICQESVRIQLCQVKKHKAKVLARMERALGDTMWTALMHPFTDGSPLTMNEGERPQAFTGLNRHLVLHGQSTDYGTRVNSLKAISLINYVAAVFDRKDSPTA